MPTPQYHGTHEIEETIMPRVEGARHIYPARLKHHRHV